MNILHIGYVKNIKQSGVSVIVPKYLEMQSKHPNINCAFLNLCDYNPNTDNAKYCVYCGKEFLSLPSPFNKPDLIIFHEIYRPAFIKLYKDALRNRIPYIIIPHGSLTNTAQKKSKLKKIIGNFFLFNKYIKSANYVHFLSEYEKNESKKFSIKDSFVIGSGINDSVDLKNIKKENILLYIGRLDTNIKGLDLIIESINLISEYIRKTKFKVKMYGTDSINCKEELLQMINKYNLNDIISINPPVFDEKKYVEYKKAYAFLQLSRTEAQCLGVMEAMTYELPVIVTEGSTFKKIVCDNELGYGVEYDPDDIAKKIKKLIENKEKAKKMGENAAKYVLKNYKWEEIVNQQYNVYIKLVGDK